MILTLGMPFFRNPTMLAEHYRLWAAWPPDLKAAVEIVLVDDGSPEPALDVPRPPDLPPLRIYRVLENIPWHQHGARNLAATVAAAPWLLLTDMDHVIPAATLTALFVRFETAPADVVYTFFRIDAPAGKPTRNERGMLKPHVNTFAIRKDHYWKIGGYDEDCVGYGTDGYFRRRLWAACHHEHLATPIVRYAREVIADASSCEPGVDPRVLRNRGRRSGETARRLAKKARTGAGPRVLAFQWAQVL